MYVIMQPAFRQIPVYFFIDVRYIPARSIIFSPTTVTGRKKTGKMVATHKTVSTDKLKKGSYRTGCNESGQEI